MNIHQRSFTYEREILLSSSKLSYTLQIIHFSYIMLWFYSFFSPSSPQILLISTSIQLHVLTLKKAKIKVIIIKADREEEDVEEEDQ